jgi:hypothetical protein
VYELAQDRILEGMLNFFKSGAELREKAACEARGLLED